MQTNWKGELRFGIPLHPPPPTENNVKYIGPICQTLKTTCSRFTFKETVKSAITCACSKFLSVIWIESNRVIRLDCIRCYSDTYGLELLRVIFNTDNLPFPPFGRATKQSAEAPVQRSCLSEVKRTHHIWKPAIDGTKSSVNQCIPQDRWNTRIQVWCIHLPLYL